MKQEHKDLFNLFWGMIHGAFSILFTLMFWILATIFLFLATVGLVYGAYRFALTSIVFGIIIYFLSLVMVYLAYKDDKENKKLVDKIKKGK